MEVLAEHSVDLFALLPVGELWVAAARMRQVDQLRHPLDQAFALLESLGNPSLWSVPLHWAGVHAGILANSPESIAPHGQALSAAAGDSTLARALSGAGRTWLRVLANQVAVDEVTAAARSLSHVGLTSDATRLAGQAALQTPDGRVSGTMLQLARDLKMGLKADTAATETPSGVPGAGLAAGAPSAPRVIWPCAVQVGTPSPSSTTLPVSAVGSAPAHVPRCCPCCAPCWLRSSEPQARGTGEQRVRGACLASKATRMSLLAGQRSNGFR